MPISQFAGADIPMDSPFYRVERPKAPTYKRGDYGPPVDGIEYREQFVQGEWRRPDGSLAQRSGRNLAGLGNLGLSIEIRPILTYAAMFSAASLLLVKSKTLRNVALATLGGSAAFLLATKG